MFFHGRLAMPCAIPSIHIRDRASWGLEGPGTDYAFPISCRTCLRGPSRRAVAAGPTDATGPSCPLLLSAAVDVRVRPWTQVSGLRKLLARRVAQCPSVQGRPDRVLTCHVATQAGGGRDFSVLQFKSWARRTKCAGETQPFNRSINLLVGWLCCAGPLPQSKGSRPFGR
ncbi:hypothetical protein BDY21DRAFT_130503 [Lineolata rhizophorae]|uniref:Uncharacterized protein n=1 Tax=Lineolata rhizophorae TaxID=578093 RepID=A0A6A6PBD0_9PEZI|nr:hypothetical protein BDY21DRAFT_130503 [Lineolata rhizophorae]